MSKVTPAPRPGAGNQALPAWLRSNPRGRIARAPLTPRDGRWWVGVVWLGLSALLLGFVGHVTLFGALQHARGQTVAYDELRGSLAAATTPVGPLDLDENLVAAGTPIAFLSIPALGVTEVIRQGTSPDVTRMGVGHKRDTVMPGQEGTAVLFGRQATYGGPFGQIATLVPGDTITITTGQGESTYTVFGLRRAGDTLPEDLDTGEGRLQLVTADGPALVPFGVLYVDAVLETDPFQTPAAAFTSAVLEGGEQPMGSEPGGWLPFVFSLQWLIVAAVVTRWLMLNWGFWHTWIVCTPILLVLGATTADAAIALVPNIV